MKNQISVIRVYLRPIKKPKNYLPITDHYLLFTDHHLMAPVWAWARDSPE